MTVSVMITTKGRLVDLRVTLRALQQLNPVAIGGADHAGRLHRGHGCSGESGVSVKRELFVNQIGLGSVASRDRMMRAARGDLVLALDDDSYPEQLDCIARIVPMFEQYPKLAVLHFPQRTNEYPETLAQTDFGPERLTRTFPNSGAVLRRSTYLQLPGFESHFFHAYEEPDYALQCVAAGYDVLFSPIITIRHHYSGQARDEIQHSSSPRAQRIVEHCNAMSFPFCSRNSWLARFLAVSLCLQTRLVMGHSRTSVVVPGAGWDSLLSSKTQACFMGGLQTLACVALEFMAQMRCIVATALCRRALRPNEGQTRLDAARRLQYLRSLGR